MAHPAEGRDPDVAGVSCPRPRPSPGMRWSLRFVDLHHFAFSMSGQAVFSARPHAVAVHGNAEDFGIGHPRLRWCNFSQRVMRCGRSAPRKGVAATTTRVTASRTRFIVVAITAPRRREIEFWNPATYGTQFRSLKTVQSVSFKNSINRSMPCPCPCRGNAVRIVVG